MPELASFALPTVHVNQDGWGPTTLPAQYVGVPFSPFGKGDRIGKAADFVGREHLRTRNGKADDIRDPDRFSLVDTSRARNTRPAFRGRWQRRKQVVTRRVEDPNKPQLRGKQLKYLSQHVRRGKQWNRPKNTGRKNFRRNAKLKEASVKVKAEWEVMEQFDLNALTKMQLQPPNGEDLKTTGSLFKYDETFESITTRGPRMLESFSNVTVPNPSTIDDPVMEKLAREVASTLTAENSRSAVFCTDEIMSQLMVCTRSVWPWDVYFTRLENDLVFIDHRSDSNLSQLTVNETAAPQSEEEESKLALYNMPEDLSIEATLINHNFQQQILKRNKLAIKEKENVAEDEAVAEKGVMFKYRKFNMGSIDVYVRTRVHALGKKGKVVSIFALNEWDAKLANSVEWRTKLDNFRGQVLSNELKNNACKLSKWTAGTLLSGAELMKIGFVSRRIRTDPSAHVILGTQSYEPRTFAVQINLSQKNMWGIFKAIVEIVLHQSPGKYLLLKDPNKNVLRLYKVPMDTFVESEEDNEDDESEDEEEEEDVLVEEEEADD